MFKNGGHWPFLLGALLFGGAAMNISMVIRASAEPIDPIENYYQKAVDWDATRAAERAAAREKGLGHERTATDGLPR